MTIITKMSQLHMVQMYVAKSGRKRARKSLPLADSITRAGYTLAHMDQSTDHLIPAQPTTPARWL